MEIKPFQPKSPISTEARAFSKQFHGRKKRKVPGRGRVLRSWRSTADSFEVPEFGSLRQLSPKKKKSFWRKIYQGLTAIPMKNPMVQVHNKNREKKMPHFPTIFCV